MASDEVGPVLRRLRLYYGTRGSGPPVEYKLKVGPITMLGLTQTRQRRLRMVVAEGESLPGMIPATGNTNTRARFEPDVRTFLERWTMEGPTHHFALGVGHIAEKIERLARCLEMECVLVTPRREAPAKGRAAGAVCRQNRKGTQRRGHAAQHALGRPGAKGKRASAGVAASPPHAGRVGPAVP